MGLEGALRSCMESLGDLFDVERTLEGSDKHEQGRKENNNGRATRLVPDVLELFLAVIALSLHLSPTGSLDRLILEPGSRLV